MNLVIVESPTKSKTIQKFLNPDFEVIACFGHVRDLPKKELGIDIDKDFEPKYLIVPKARKILKLIKDKAKKVSNLYLATDYDREGEAIAWHIVKAEGLDEEKTPAFAPTALKLRGTSKATAGKQNPKVKRITFHEITKEAIAEALKHPRDINYHLVDAQQARRVLDRLVGYKLSPFLWHKVARGLSAGRVQSVALRLIVERDKEIQNFTPQEYWSLEALFSFDKKVFKGVLNKIDNKKIDRLFISSQKEAQKYLDDLYNTDYKVIKVQKEDKKRYPSPPFTTSTLQQEAGNVLHFSARQTMKLAQNLYEEGLITYMRTDSVHVAEQALRAAQKVIQEKYGREYALLEPRYYKTKSKSAQEAHEAIRPTNLELVPENLKQEEGKLKLYSLIWQRMIASQTKEALIIEENVEIEAKNFIFLASGLQIKFPGFLKIYNKLKNGAENHLPALKVGDKVNLEKLEKIQHFTEPPARFTEASLIKELEKRGIGRPSTYAPTISTITDRGYVVREQGKLLSQDIGRVVNEVLTKHFPEIVDYNFTAKLEEELDNIAEGELKWQEVIANFYKPFSEHLKIKLKEVSKEDLSEETNEKCPECQKPLKIKFGRYGKFLACSGFPECKFTKPILKEESSKAPLKEKMAKDLNKKCPQCQVGEIVLKEGKFGPFLACSKYPKCRYTKNIAIEANVPCPNCGGKIVRKNTKKGRTFWGCANFPKCKTAFWQEPTSKRGAS